MRLRSLALCSFLPLLAGACDNGRSASALGQSTGAAPTTVVPNAYDSMRGGEASRTLVTSLARTYMVGIAASQLSAIPVGAVVNGMSMRASVFRQNAEEWPAANHTFDACAIRLGRAKPLATWKKTLRDNFEDTPTAVRQGPMVIPPSTFRNDMDLAPPAANPFGEFYWDFKTPFTYEGGDLAILITHLGGTGGEGLFFDAAPGDAALGYVAYTGTGYEAEKGTATSVLVLRLHYGFGEGCPGSNNAVPNLVSAPTRTDASHIDATLQLSHGLPAAPTALILGVDRTDLPLGNGCTLLTTPGVLLPAPLDGSGGFRTTLTVPTDGLDRLVLQSVLIDAGAPGGYTLSNAVEIRE
ncbi:MAG: hypothetical protein R3F56_14620 [Planctomycetota bacterium]